MGSLICGGKNSRPTSGNFRIGPCRRLDSVSLHRSALPSGTGRPCGQMEKRFWISWTWRTVTMNSSVIVQSPNRDLRQRDLVPPERLADCHALVIGVGAIGRQVALQLAAVGVPILTLFDDDTVQVENLAPQGDWLEDLHFPKVEATAALCRRINPDVRVTASAERFKRSTARTLAFDRRLVVFLCVDSIQGRRLLWETLGQQASFMHGQGHNLHVQHRGRADAGAVHALAAANACRCRSDAQPAIRRADSVEPGCSIAAASLTKQLATP